jgi:hypothetical protein
MRKNSARQSARQSTRVPRGNAAHVRSDPPATVGKTQRRQWFIRLQMTVSAARTVVCFTRNYCR